MPPTESSIDVRAFWNAAAAADHRVAIYDDPAVRDPRRAEEAFRRLGERDAERLAWFVAPGMRVLDVGCGAGRVLGPLAPRVRAIVGADVSDEMLARARGRVDAPNASFVRTDGRSLAPLETGSFDFAYSLLCLIHADKKSAFRTLRDLARVLRPGALAHLQFQTLADERGLQKFLDGLDQDMPLEFYGPLELPGFLAAAGLEPVAMHRAQEYCFATVVNGNAERWVASYQGGIALESPRTEGFAPRPGALPAGRLEVAVRSRAASPLPFLATLRVRGAGRVTALEAPLWIEPGARAALAFEVDGDGSARLSWNGTQPADARAWKEEGVDPHEATLDAGLLPPAQVWSDETLRRFPGLVLSRRLA